MGRDVVVVEDVCYFFDKVFFVFDIEVVVWCSDGLVVVCGSYLYV